MQQSEEKFNDLCKTKDIMFKEQARGQGQCLVTDEKSHFIPRED